MTPAVVLTSSSAGLKGTGTDRAGGQAYTAAKRGLVGLMQVWANHLAQYSIRVNTIHPTGVATGMVMNEAMAALVAAEDVAVTAMQNALPIPVLMPEDIAGAVADRFGMVRVLCIGALMYAPRASWGMAS